jgi:hypothetical protein
VDGGFDFSPITNDCSIGHQSFDVFGGHRGYGAGVESVKPELGHCSMLRLAAGR